jgi:hypothetical protein
VIQRGGSGHKLSERYPTCGYRFIQGIIINERTSPKSGGIGGFPELPGMYQRRRDSSRKYCHEDKVFSAVFAVVVGIGMIGQWVIFPATGLMPELETNLLRIRFHLVAEFATAIAMLVSGIALLTDRALLYTMIVSPDYLAKKSHWASFGILAVMLIMVLINIVLIF